MVHMSSTRGLILLPFVVFAVDRGGFSFTVHCWFYLRSIASLERDRRWVPAHLMPPPLQRPSPFLDFLMPMMEFTRASLRRAKEPGARKLVPWETRSSPPNGILPLPG